MNRTRSIALMLISVLLFTACSSTKKLSGTTADFPETNPNLTEINPKLSDGLSFENAIIVNSIKAEYEWLSKNYPGSVMQMQALTKNKNKPYDILHIVTADGEEKSIYFDISKFYGK